MPMTKDQELLRKSHEEAVSTTAGYLEAGCNCVFLTLGDHVFILLIFMFTSNCQNRDIGQKSLVEFLHF